MDEYRFGQYTSEAEARADGFESMEEANDFMDRCEAEETEYLESLTDEELAALGRHA